MGFVELSSALSSEIASRRDCLEKAKNILVADDSCDSKINTRNDRSQAYIDSLVSLHDSLQEQLSKSAQGNSSLKLIYSQFHHARWPTEGFRNAQTADIDRETIRVLFGLEADLHRAMWLCCLILIDRIYKSNNREQHGRKRSRRELDDPTCDDGNRKILLQRTIGQCRLLVRLLEQIEFEPDSSTAYTDHHVKSNIWDECIREWTKDKNDEFDDEYDKFLNVLSFKLFTKEQLEREEQELMIMAETPIPTVSVHNQNQQQQLKKKDMTSNSANGNTTETKKPLMGMLVATGAETLSSPSPISIQLDDCGVLRAAEKLGMGDDELVDDDKDLWWWSITPRSVVHCDDNESPNKIRISNTISIRTAEMTTITLDVGKDSMLWLEQISRIQAITKRNCNEKSAEEREEIQQLWPVDEVTRARAKARELFTSVIREGK